MNLGVFMCSRAQTVPMPQNASRPFSIYADLLEKPAQTRVVNLTHPKKSHRQLVICGTV